MKNLLEVKKLETVFNTEKGEVIAIRDVNFNIEKGRTVAIVGESGSGKSVTSLSILGLLSNKGAISKGEILFEGENLLKLGKADMCNIRGNKISMVFQEPMTSLNPLFTIGYQMMEGIKLHFGMSKKEARNYVIDMLNKVGIPRAEKIMDEYPHSLSGGMRQRVMIAMALICKPKLLIADEPTTALDVTIQAQILELIKSLKEEFSMSIMLITHDLGVVSEMADEVIVMYAGEVVEKADVFTLFDYHKHPYTKGLLNSIPQIYGGEKRLISIQGNVPSNYWRLEGCRFSSRCPLVEEKCYRKAPSLIEVEEGHFVRCLKYGDGEESNE